MATTHARRSSGRKPAGRLAALAETRKVETTLLGDIQSHLLKKAGPGDRRQDVIHPSEMAKYDWCPRQTYYRLAGVTPTNPPKATSAQLETIFEEGHEIHGKWQRLLADMGRIWGVWECPVCERRVTGLAPQRCMSCQDRKNIVVEMDYREVPLNGYDRYRIIGHADGAVPDVKAILEIKSIGLGTLRLEDPGHLAKHQVETTEGKKVYDLEGLWKALKRPLPSHLRQTNIYLRLAKELGMDYDKVVFLYEFKATQAVKEFTVKYSPTIADPLFETARDIKYAVTKGKPVDRPDHADSPEAKVCKECPFRLHCWGDNVREESAAPSDTTTGRRVVRRPSSRRVDRRHKPAAGTIRGMR